MPRIAVERRRELLVDAAFAVIARRGVEGATTRAICAEAKMALASFHYAFESRDELLAAVVQRGTSAEMSAVTAPLAVDTRSDDLGTALRAGLAAYIDSVAADPAREQAMITLAQYARRTVGLEHFAAQIYDRYYEIAELSLTMAANSCGAEWATAPNELAPIAVAATDGITLAYLAQGDRVVADRIADEAVATLLRHAKGAR